MQFLFVIEGLAVQAGGPPRVAAAIANLLVKRGHGVAFGTVPVSSQQVILDERVRVEHLAPSASLTHARLAASRMRELSKDADAVIVSGIWGAIDGLALRLANVASDRLFIRACGMLEPYILAKSRLKKCAARVGYVNHNLVAAAAVLANTELERGRILDMYPAARVEVIPNGVEIPDMETLSRPDAADQLGVDLPVDSKTILYLGRIDPKKGLDLFLPQFCRLRDRDPSWQMLVAGSFSDAQFQSKIEAIVKGHEGNVHFVGEVSGLRKDACFRLADGFVLPSHSEGFPNAVVEALSWGLPALITPGCNFPEIQDAGAGLITSLDQVEMHTRLIEFCTSFPLADAGRNARKLAKERYTLDHVADLYERLASK